MGFFKEFKDDLSQAVNELLPEDELQGEKKEIEDTIINTLDQDENNVEGDIDHDRIGEWLDGLSQESPDYVTEEAIDLSEEVKLTTEEAKSAEEVSSEEAEEAEEEGEAMEENVDLELLEAMNLDEEEATNETDKNSTPKARSASQVNEDEVTVITKGTTINGSISSDGSLDIMGSITGDVECLGKLSITGKIKGNSSAAEVYVNTERMEGSITSEGSVKVGLGTVIIGDIMATSGVIAGAVKGEIDINGPIVIDSTAIIKGNIKAKSVQINNGAVIEGFCSLSYSSVDVENIFE